MTSGIHRDYQRIFYRGKAAGFAFLTGSMRTSHVTAIWSRGQECPDFHVDISSASHPFYVGAQRVSDTAGHVGRFNRKHPKPASGAPWRTSPTQAGLIRAPRSWALGTRLVGTGRSVRGHSARTH